MNAIAATSPQVATNFAAACKRKTNESSSDSSTDMSDTSDSNENKFSDDIFDAATKGNLKNNNEYTDNDNGNDGDDGYSAKRKKGNLQTKPLTTMIPLRMKRA